MGVPLRITRLPPGCTLTDPSTPAPSRTQFGVEAPWASGTTRFPGTWPVIVPVHVVGAAQAGVPPRNGTTSGTATPSPSNILRFIRPLQSVLSSVLYVLNRHQGERAPPKLGVRVGG